MPAEIGPFVDALNERIATFPPEAIRLAKQTVLRAEGEVDDALVHEERAFFESAATPAAKRAMAAAMNAGFQMPEVERQPITKIYRRLG